MAVLICIDHDPVYDVSNRETFEALPRWYSELETYVSESVVKIIVGNKVDKVRHSPPDALLRLVNTDSHRSSPDKYKLLKGRPLPAV
jgi:GTPase SAR1 family protein